MINFTGYMMKKNLTILLLLIPVFGLGASFTTTNVSDEISDRYVILNQTDTLPASHWLKIDPFELGLIPPSSGVQFYREGIVFLTSSKYEDKMADNQISFGKLDARYATITDTVAESIKVFSPSVPFPYPCEALTFTGNYDTMYFTRYSVKERVEKIYQAIYSSEGGKDGFWSFSDEPMSFCTGKSTYTHPALSKDGKVIVFASNREGSVGGMDLFVSLRKKGVWTDPVNLGDAVNSTANELYPFLDSENNLFFSSDDPQGFGGYDVYVCKFKGNTWGKPVILSSAVNTRYDDVAFTISRNDSKTGFYTVKQSSGKGSQQLYKVTMNKSLNDTILNLSQFFTRPDISQMVILALEPAVQATDKASQTATLTHGAKDTITYRVQFMTSFNPRTRQHISVDGKDYTVYEFLYSGAYRLCVGEFSSLSTATELRDRIRGGEYPRATVIAFKNNVYSLDPELLKESSNSGNESKTNKSGAETVNTTAVTETVASGNDKKDPPVSEKGNNETLIPVVTVPPVMKDVVIYRIQIATNSIQKGTYKINVDKKSYDTFEYKYSGAYRICIGEFSTLSAASEFQKTCRQNGYPQAFVIAFKNNIRTNDPALFR